MSSGMDTYEGGMKDIIPTLKNAVPLKRMSTEAEVSSGIVFLLSEGAAFITGICMPVDGGAPLYSSVWPTPKHNASVPYDGFHRAVTPKVLEND